jgi:hypothetical protein
MSRRYWIAIGIAAVASLGVGLQVAVMAQGGDPEQRPGEVSHKVPPDIGDFDAIEVPEGLTYRGAQTFALSRGTVIIPQAYGVVWAYGYDSPRHGLIVYLPAGTIVFFDEDSGEVEIQEKAAKDSSLIKALLASAPYYKVRPNRLTGELP